jgi:DNA-binding NtrC family response regulator
LTYFAAGKVNSYLLSLKSELSTAGLHDAVESLERKMIEQALEQTQGHRGATARLLKIPRRCLQRKIQKYDLKLPASPRHRSG